MRLILSILLLSAIALAVPITQPQTPSSECVGQTCLCNGITYSKTQYKCVKEEHEKDNPNIVPTMLCGPGPNYESGFDADGNLKVGLCGGQCYDKLWYFCKGTKEVPYLEPRFTPINALPPAS